MSGTGYIGNTDFVWYRNLLARQRQLEEVNFWRPGSGHLLRSLEPGAPFLLRLKAQHGGAIAGFGFFSRAQHLTIREAWTYFGVGNGAGTLAELVERIGRYRTAEPATANTSIGCLLLVAPVLFPEHMWVEGPAGWKQNIVSGRRFDRSEPEYQRIWSACLENARQLQNQLGSWTATELERVWAPGSAGTGRVIYPRLGQQTFRLSLVDAYGRACAVTNEHSLPVLDAAHIIPHADGGSLDPRNGLLLRADVHRLFDDGYVTVTPDHVFKVSERLREDYNNGRIYYELHGRRIRVPDNPALQPARDNLALHGERYFEHWSSPG